MLTKMMPLSVGLVIVATCLGFLAVFTRMFLIQSPEQVDQSCTESYASSVLTHSDLPEPRNGEVLSKGEITLVHDFGVVLPGSRNVHRFAIENPTSFPWSVKTIETTCACTVPNLSGDEFSAGSTGWIDIAFKAPAKTSDDSRRVSVLFVETDAPRLNLVVNAQTRLPLTAIPSELQFCGTETNNAIDRVLEIENWTGLAWDDISAKSEASWLTVEQYTRVKGTTASISAGSASDQRSGTANLNDSQPTEITRPCETWRATVRCWPAKCPQDYATSHITFTVDRKPETGRMVLDADSVEIPVCAQIVPAVRLIPSTFHFDVLQPGGSASESMRVVFTQGADVPRPQTIQLVTDIPEFLTLDWRPSDGRVSQLIVTFTAGHRAGLIEGNISFMDRGKTIARTMVSAFVME